MNLLLHTDVYKMGHMEQYPEGTTHIYSYLGTRSNEKYDYTVFFGLQYYLKKYLSKPVMATDVVEFLQMRKSILGTDAPQHVVDKLNTLVNLGYLPLEIKAVPEGYFVETKNVLMTITNTVAGFHWLVPFVESLLLKVWNTCTVASLSLKYKELFFTQAMYTDGDLNLVDFQVHDFGYRGCSSEETAALSGAAHLLGFRGTDTVPAVKLLQDYYNGTGLIGASVPASEHSVMCSYGRENEIKAFEHMLDTYPEGIVSIVSDTYNLWNVLTNFAPRLKERILARNGKVVFRPDSGDPINIICGDKNAPKETPEYKGVLKLLEEVFGSELNGKFKRLNPKVGIIYGDAMYYDRTEEMLSTMEEQGWSSSNLVIGVGGLLLQQHNRDDQGFAFKASRAQVNGEWKNVVKDPITDNKKKSYSGELALTWSEEHDKFITIEGYKVDDSKNELKVVYYDGKIEMQTLEEIRDRYNRFFDNLIYMKGV